MKIEPNTDFVNQTGEIEKLKATRKRQRGEEKQEAKKEETTAVVQNDFVAQELAKFNISDAVIAEWKKDFLPLQVTGVDDKEGMTKVTEAWRTVRNTRISIEKKGKELRADAIRFQKSVISEEKRLVDELTPIEEHLEKQKNFVEEQKERIRQEKEKQIQIRVQSRTAELVKLGYSFNGDSYELITDEGTIKISTIEVKMFEDPQFNVFVLKGQIWHEKERVRLEEEERVRKEEQARLAKIAEEQEAERKRLEAIRLEQERKEAEIKAAQEKLEADKRAAEQAKIRAEELERAKTEAAAKALKDAEEKRKAEEAAKAKAEQECIAKEKAAEAERLRLETLKPDKEKIAVFAEKFAIALESVKYPEVESEQAKKLILTYKEQTAKFAAWSRKQTNTIQ